MSSIQSIRNFVQLTPTIGTAGQPRTDEFEFIAAENFKSVINIAMPDHPDSIDQEGRLVTELGMNYYHLPVPFEHPTIDHVADFCKLMRSQQQSRIFVHCIMNYRVSVFMHHYLTCFEGYTAQQARSGIFDHWQIEPQWQKIMDLGTDEILGAADQS